MDVEAAIYVAGLLVMLPQRQGAIIKRILPSAAACLSLILFQRRAMTNTRWVGSIAWRVPWRQGRSSASCTGGQRTPRRARPVATICAATTAERSWRPRSRPRTSDTSRGPRPRHAGTLRRRTRRQSRRRRTAPRRRSGTRGGSATTALASRRKRRACNGRQCKKPFTKLAHLVARRKNQLRAA